MEQLDLRDSEWNCCVIGNGVSALWLSHWLWSTKKSVLWITSEEPYGAERAMLQHGWLWSVNKEAALALSERLQGFDAESALPSSEFIYYDARSARRFRRFGEAKQEFFNRLGETAQESGSTVDLWSWHSRLHAFHDSGAVNGPTQVELFRDPRFVRVQGWPLLELKTEKGKIVGAVLAGRAGSQTEVRAERFFLGDFDEHLPGLIKNEGDAQALAAALKGRSYRAGFGLRLRHKALESAPTQTTVVPLVVNPGVKDGGSHLAGRFVQTPGGLESLWVGFLTDEELEDNNEILKKIKQAKRAVDRAIPGFSDSIEREAVTFEPRMSALNLVKSRKTEALGAGLISDHCGPEAAVEAVRRIIS
jgi:hypothetical protein